MAEGTSEQGGNEGNFAQYLAHLVQEINIQKEQGIIPRRFLPEELDTFYEKRRLAQLHYKTWTAVNRYRKYQKTRSLTPWESPKQDSAKLIAAVQPYNPMPALEDIP